MEKQKKSIKKSKKTKKVSYLKSVKSELKKVKWPSKLEIVKYTIATLVFIIIVTSFFVALNLLMSFIKGVL